MGGGIAGLTSAMLLAGDGHHVTALERDPAPPCAPGAAWSEWERRGVGQFRLPHFFLPRFCQVLDAELPDLAATLEAEGAANVNRIVHIPEAITGGWRQGDERFETLTGRRPMMEAAIARAAEREPGVDVVAREGIVDTLLALGPADPAPGPSREELVGIIGAD